MTKNIHIEQVGKFYKNWESSHVRYAVDSLTVRTGSLLEKELDLWIAGLESYGWTYRQAVRFTGDMRLVMRGKRIYGPW